MAKKALALKGSYPTLDLHLTSLTEMIKRYEERLRFIEKQRNDLSKEIEANRGRIWKDIKEEIKLQGLDYDEKRYCHLEWDDEAGVLFAKEHQDRQESLPEFIKKLLR